MTIKEFFEISFFKRFDQVVSVGAGLHHSVALWSDGLVSGWGDSRRGQFGNRRTLVHFLFFNFLLIFFYFD
jgi:alpha-tubulin suppressor-like RCC1 family protein